MPEEIEQQHQDVMDNLSAVASSENEVCVISGTNLFLDCPELEEVPALEIVLPKVIMNKNKKANLIQASAPVVILFDNVVGAVNAYKAIIKAATNGLSYFNICMAHNEEPVAAFKFNEPVVQAIDFGKTVCGVDNTNDEKSKIIVEIDHEGFEVVDLDDLFLEKRKDVNKQSNNQSFTLTHENK